MAVRRYIGLYVHALVCVRHTAVAVVRVCGTSPLLLFSSSNETIGTAARICIRIHDFRLEFLVGKIMCPMDIGPSNIEIQSPSNIIGPNVH
jgi:hypothetical protein